MGIMDTLGTKPRENFEKIRKAIAKRMISKEEIKIKYQVNLINIYQL